VLRLRRQARPIIFDGDINMTVFGTHPNADDVSGVGRIDGVQ